MAEIDEELEENAVLPIHEVAFNGEYDDVKKYVDSGADIDIPDRTGMTPFLFAVWGGHYETAKMLEDAGADIHHVAHSSGNGAMHLAASQSHFEMVVWITKELGVKSLGVSNQLGRNPLHMACQAGSIEGLEHMVDAGGDLTATATNGDTPLHVCVAEGHIKMSNVLISLGADYDAPNKLGYTPLHVAVQAGHQHIVRDLVAIPEIEIHKNARNGMSAVVMAEKGKVEHPEIYEMLREAAEQRPPPSPKKTAYKSRTMSRIASRSMGKPMPGRGLVRAESKATLNSKKVISKFDHMLSNAESEEAKRLAALKEAEEKRKKELELIAAREAQELELARVRMEEEKKQRIEDKKKKMREDEEKEKAAKEAGEKLRQRIEAEKAKEKHRKEAAELAIRKAKEERAAKEAADKVEAVRIAAEKAAKEEADRLAKAEAEKAEQLAKEEADRLAAEELRKAEEEAKLLSDQLAEQLAEQLAAEQQAAMELEAQKEAERLALSRQAEEELLAQQREEEEKARREKEREKDRDQEMEQLRQETARLAALLEEERQRREDSVVLSQLQGKIDDDAATKSRFEAAKAQAEAEKAIAEAEKAKADAERAKAEMEKAKTDANFSKRKAEILEQAAKIRQQEADDARERRLHEQQLQARRLSFDQQRLDIEDGLTRAEKAAKEKKEAWKTAQMQAEVEAMRLKLEAVEAERSLDLHLEPVIPTMPKKTSQHMSDVVDLTASSHAGLSLKRLNERARMSQRSISAAQGVQKQRLHNFVKTQSMPDADYRFGAFASDSPGDRVARHSIGSPQGRVIDTRFTSFQNPVMRHSMDGREVSFSNSRGRGSFKNMSFNSELSGQGRKDKFSRSKSLDEKGRNSNSGAEVNTETKTRKSVSMKIPSPQTPVPANSSSPRPSNRLLNKNTSIGHLSESGGGMVTPPPSGPLHINVDPSTGGTDNSGSPTKYGLTPNSAQSQDFSPGVQLDLRLDGHSPSRTPRTSMEGKDQMMSSQLNGRRSESSSPDKERFQDENKQNDNDNDGEEKLSPAVRLANKKKAEAERVRLRRKSEAKNFEKRKIAAEVVAIQDHKKQQAEELAKYMYLEKVIDHATTERVKVEAEEAARVKAAKSVIDAAHRDSQRRHSDGYSNHKGSSGEEVSKHMYLDNVMDHASSEKVKVEAEESARVKAARSVIEAANRDNQRRYSEGYSIRNGSSNKIVEHKVSPSNSIEEKKSNSDQEHEQELDHHASSSRPPMGPRVKSLVLGDFSIRHMPMKTSSSNLMQAESTQSSNVKTLLDDDDSNSDESSVHNMDMHLDTAVDDYATPSVSVLKHRFSSQNRDEGPRSFEEKKSIDSPSPSTTSSTRRFSGDRSNTKERQQRFQNGSNSGSGSAVGSPVVKKSLSSLNHVHNNSAARLGDLVISEGAKSSSEMFALENMDAFDDMFGEWIGIQAKLQPHETLPDDHLDNEQSLDKYITETLRRGSEINWRLGKLEGKLPHPEGIHEIRKLLHEKIQTLKKLRDRKDSGAALNMKELGHLRNELHNARNMCLDAVDRERVRLNDPEHVLQEEFDQIANL
mmetsp:Transcript_2618/g.4766  ORF Transcript_2618/g.4766 Transcript_2618/m.4766 type:complete len:1557 (+) Transcript_2618:155-4825(+)|eukprot:CAMPEP_0114432590 /NCGR_PEP_ID=MMETSP0103-20121206/11234_1 /TAXON_ID=37642 ORGANISM="Paraphysomonas imperforata, Strain PA2" /NCGR_SAMPLE_ID=MMETSP0103 /ASSEMBLY_ACC=CAM_ASM_000201 /LENGTH=1556 /DNA_ID=CAMNT_0001602271 /DNA_START=154 /DNA_END=4824 /DNA_ORIENTATION=+